jgi:hypothetical protein
VTQSDVIKPKVYNMQSIAPRVGVKNAGSFPGFEEEA